MGSTRSERLRRRLVETLEAEGLGDPAVRRAFLKTPRELFVPEFAEREGLEAVYRDEAIITRTDDRGAPTSSSSQPTIMALMLERLRLGEGMRVLEIGAGTGYNAALLSSIVGQSGRVVSVELDPDLARKARGAIAASGQRARVVVGDGRLGWASGAPYDRIVVTASAAEVPPAWPEQLRDDGLIEAPLVLRRDGAQAIPTLRKDGAELSSVSVLCGGFMPLRVPGASPQEVPRLVASDIAGGEARQLVQLSGSALETLSAPARRRLLALALSRPRVHRLRLSRPGGRGLWLFLSLELPARSQVVSLAFGAVSIGFVDRAARSLALFSHAPTTEPRMSAYGEPEAEEKVLGFLEEWKRRGEPTEQDLCLMVTKRGVRWRWR